MLFNELKMGQKFAYPENPENKYRVTFKSDSAIHFSGLNPGPTYIILDEYFGWVACVIPD